MGKRAVGKPYKKATILIKLKIFLFIIISILSISIIYISISFDEKIIPTAIAISEMEAKNRINEIIYEVLNRVTKENNITTLDFYNKIEDGNGRIQSLSVNTILLNELCSKIAMEVSQDIEKFKYEMVEIPLGVLSGIDVFSSLGPKYGVTIMPVGNAVADYETKFEAVGINQINFQVWIDIKATVQVLIPLHEQELTLNRKVAVVNTVFGGNVPNMYFNNLPLFTEPAK